MLNEGQNLFAYSFHGYWKDVGTIDSLWEANMDLINHPAVSCTPHIGAATKEAQGRIGEEIVEIISKF